MAKIKSLEELKKIKEQAKNPVSLRVKGENIENLIQVRVAMATCGIAAGARETMDEFIKVLGEQNMDNVVVTQTGCMGYCYAEPTIELTIPGKEPVVYGHVDVAKVHEIIEKGIKGGEMLDGIIPVTHNTVE